MITIQISNYNKFYRNLVDYPINEIRDQFPSLKNKYNDKSIIFLDGPSGTQMVQSCIDGMVDYMMIGNANLGGHYPTAIASDELMENARESMADFLGGSPDEIAFGQNMTSLTFDISRALSRDWTDADNIVVTEMDHRANVDPWIEAARDKGVEVRWLRLDTEELVLDTSNLHDIIDANTQVVAIGQASNGIGTINDVEGIAKVGKTAGATVVMDAVHSAPHMFIDREKLGVDIVLCSAYKFFGPHTGIASVKQELFDQMKTYKLTTVPDEIPHKLETGTQSFESIAGVVGAVEFIAGLGEGSTRRDRIEDAFEKIHFHEYALASKIRDKLATYDEVRLLQADGDKTPTIAFRIDGKSPKRVCSELAEEAIYAGDGHFYAKTIGDVLDLNKTGGWVRIGIAPYTSNVEIDRFLLVIDKIIKDKI